MKRKYLLLIIIVSIFILGMTNRVVVDGTFMVDNSDTGNIPPVITIVYPNGGENLQGEVYVQWSAEDPDGDTSQLLFIGYYSNDQSNWQILPNLINRTDSSQSDYWDVTNIPEGEYWLKIEAFDGIDTAYDITDDSFHINSDVLPPLPTSGQVINSFNAGGRNGVTHDDDNFLYTSTNNHLAKPSVIYIYDMDTNNIVNNFSKPYPIMGLAYGGGYLWAVDETYNDNDGNNIKQLDPLTGVEIQTYYTVRGGLADLTWLDGKLWMQSSNRCYLGNGDCFIFDPLGSQTITTAFHVNMDNSWGLGNDGYYLYVVGGLSGNNNPTVQIFTSDTRDKVSEFTLTEITGWQGMTFWNNRLYIASTIDNTSTIHEIALDYGGTVSTTSTTTTATQITIIPLISPGFQFLPVVIVFAMLIHLKKRVGGH